ncbi:hypothetical protein Hte_002672 [Hypoxylon texense]
MRVEAKARRPFQQVYLWTLSTGEGGTDGDSGGGGSLKRKGAAKVKCDPSVDGPKNSIPRPILPNPEDLLPNKDAKLYVEVGLIIGDEPDRYKPAGTARSKSRQEAMEERGVMRRDESAMRVFIPANEYIQPQAKFYVGCQPYRGRLFLRVVEAACIFFYPEFWNGVDDKQPAKKRLTDMTAMCKRRAAVNKTMAPKLDRTDEKDDIMPHTGREGIKSFMNFAKPMIAERCAVMAEELKVDIPSIGDLLPETIKAT